MGEQMHDDLAEYQAQLAERDAEIAALRAELTGVIEGHKAAVELWQQQDYNNGTVIAALKAKLSTWEDTGDAIMLCAVGREAPLSDSDVCGEINALRAQVAELQATVKKLQAEIHAADIRGVLDWTS